jgi:hypothetical protein
MSTYITDDEILYMLGRDAISRKLRDFRLSSLRFSLQPRSVHAGTRFVVSNSRIGGPEYKGNNNELARASARLFKIYPLLKIILCDNIVACGGAVAKSIWNARLKGGDVDLFFINGSEDLVGSGGVCTPYVSTVPTPAKMTTILCDAIERMAREVRSQGGQMFISRNTNTVTVNVIGKGKNNGGDAHTCTKYQFVLRIYSTIAEILGGFDIQAAAVAFDGEQFLSTEFGEWSCINKIIVADTTRRSTTYESRLYKYIIYCDIVFVGLDSNVLCGITEAQKSVCRDEINKYLVDFDLEFDSRGAIGPIDGDLHIKAIDEFVRARGYTIPLDYIAPIKRVSRKIYSRARKILASHRVNFDFDAPVVYDMHRFKIYKYGESFMYACNRSLMANDYGYTELSITKYSDYEWYHVAKNFACLRKCYNEAVCSVTTGDKVLEVGCMKALTNGVVFDGLNGLNSYRDQYTAFYANLAIRVSIIISNTFAYMSQGSVLGCHCGGDCYHKHIGGKLSRKRLQYLDITESRSTYRKRIKNLFGPYAEEVLTLLQVSPVDDISGQAAGVGNDVGAVGVVNGSSITDYPELQQYVDSPVKHPIVMKVYNIISKLQGEIADRMLTATQSLREINWITRNPTRQWTSSINPIFKAPADWYGIYYTRVSIGDEALERYMWRARVVAPFNRFPREIFRKIMLLVLFDYETN